MGHVNIEIKARCPDRQTIRATLRTRNADFRGVDQQIDTYFKVNRGRLKLREGQIENYLVYYEREDRAGPKRSDVTLFPLAPGSSLKEILTESLGTLVVVEKQREIYFIENVKFHIDTVKDLGSFVEIEAIDADGTIGKEKLLAQCQSFLELLRIAEDDLVAISYSDLILAKVEGGVRLPAQ
ncbi:MAG TPA: class IV adenylate cyclase [Candidatus Binatia bacterium]|jgi:predicted adenylyl cyclase CyaB|nr:class IV adenylate cyclase [Candidatus Binatia bacterium]